MHWYESCPGTASLKEFLVQEISEHEKLLSVRQYGSGSIGNHYSHLQIIQRHFDWCYWWFNKAFCITKLKITSSWYRTKSKATTGVKKFASYICWLYTTWDQLAASNMIPCDFFWWQQPLYKLFASSSNNSCWLS